jgi:hypothetical protein
MSTTLNTYSHVNSIPSCHFLYTSAHHTNAFSPLPLLLPTQSAAVTVTVCTHPLAVPQDFSCEQVAHFISDNFIYIQSSLVGNTGTYNYKSQSADQILPLLIQEAVKL